ncbi:hypothetical protein RN001_005768 [Aquatica leii]|uniref:DUF8040 domain-containing protein n=1 Tax=Aquatica leii TaxID=1421715 RepID=A0AAN7SJ47_9COLE|nr:hypothetical protein RN001_005768 [Aquatica leii]
MNFGDLLYTSSSSSEEEDEIELPLRYIHNQLQNRGEPSRIKNFLEVTIPNCTDKEFQNHFRVRRQTFQSIIVQLAPLLEKQEGINGRNPIPIEKQVLSTLWLLATPDSYRSVGDRFDLSKSSLFRSFTRVVQALNHIAPQIIKWPERAERQNIKI